MVFFNRRFGSKFPQQSRTSVRTASRRWVGTKSVVPVTSKQAEINLAKRVMQLSKIVKNQAPELKHFDAALSFTDVADTAGGISHLTAIAQGTDNLLRIGDEITVRKIYIQTRVILSSGSVPILPLDTNFCRFILVQDLQQIGDTSPTVSQMFAVTSSPQTPLLNIDSLGRFKILWMSPLKLFTMMASKYDDGVISAQYSNPTQSPIDDAWITVNTKVRYNGSASTDIQKNGLYLVCLSSLPGDTLDADGFVRLAYTDS